uniref:Reelin domain-containing protein n=1 Tax=Spongospora subterranea TaxID=70186 RepID=A0A0H5QSL5_9EUKA|eukprot:CRZ04933.1 hypothetical protein [Spongospora subterranea]
MGGPSTNLTKKFNISFIDLPLKPSQSITVKVSANIPSFKGILLVARTSCLENTDASGSFTQYSSDGVNFANIKNSNVYAFKSCNGSPFGRVTHTNANRKAFPVYFKWTAPATDTLVYFDVIVVDSAHNDWTQASGFPVTVGAGIPSNTTLPHCSREEQILAESSAPARGFTTFPYVVSSILMALLLS